MDYEKAYKDALERARELKNKLEKSCSLATPTGIESIFLELKESEDEKTRKYLIDFVEQYGDNYYGQIAKASAIAWLEKQGNQKSVDKVESRFKVGDWVVDKRGESARILEVKEDCYGTQRYYMEFTDGTKTDPMPCFADEEFHIFTIDDAKDGDILETDFGIGIFKEHADSYNAYCYCYYNDENGLVVSNNELLDEYQATPATKEQRELLFQKMKEAGYEWNAEKKKLKKIKQKLIDSYCQDNCKGFQETGKCFSDGECKAKREAEQKPAWSEEDEKMMQYILKCVNASSFNYAFENIQIWFRNIKNRVQLQQKQEWSTDEKEKITNLKTFIAKCKGFNKENIQKAFDMIDSLKPQPHWKPTEEQMHCFKCVIDFYKIKVNDNIVQNLLDSLYNNLKKL